jgi:small subunit ribosomal protein S10
MIYVYLKSYNIRLLNLFIKKFLFHERTFLNPSDKITVKGPINLPKKIKKYTVIRSPHVYSLSREQFEIITHRRLIVLKNEKNSMLSLKSRLKLYDFYRKGLYRYLPIGVSIKILIKD